jgi:hypothetical protein
MPKLSDHYEATTCWSPPKPVAKPIEFETRPISSATEDPITLWATDPSHIND